jgi:hypothetical protein
MREGRWDNVDVQVAENPAQHVQDKESRILIGLQLRVDNRNTIHYHHLIKCAVK